jgi:hypothetical protein
MPHGLRRRFWLELVLGSITSGLAVVTVFWRDWIETVFRVDPDKGSGSAEWLAIVIFLAVTVILAVSARAEWRRARLAEA